MTDIILLEEKKQFQSKNYKVSFSLFLFIVILIGLMVIGYISSNIVLMKLGKITNIFIQYLFFMVMQEISSIRDIIKTNRDMLILFSMSLFSLSASKS